VRWKRKRRLRWTIGLLCAVFAATGSYVYTAQNTVPTTYAGSGAGPIGAYAVNSPTYTIDSNNPQGIASITFTLTPMYGSTAPANVQAQLQAGGTWYSCTASLTPVCTTSAGTETTASTSDVLTVVAVQ
jgi:hypothetical protein